MQEAHVEEISSSNPHKSVPAFLRKLHKMVEDPDTPGIQWNKDGTRFIVSDGEVFSKNVLPRYFKHNNFASFIRQLNMYAFRKVTDVSQGVVTEGSQHVWEFQHQYFIRGRPDLLPLIHRKTYSAPQTNDRQIVVKGQTGDASGTDTLIQELQMLKLRQSELESQLASLQAENRALWVDSQNAQKKHDKTIQKILEFLALYAPSGLKNGHTTRRTVRQLLDSSGLLEPSSNFNISEMDQEEDVQPEKKRKASSSHPKRKAGDRTSSPRTLNSQSGQPKATKGVESPSIPIVESPQLVLTPNSPGLPYIGPSSNDVSQTLYTTSSPPAAAPVNGDGLGGLVQPYPVEAALPSLYTQDANGGATLWNNDYTYSADPTANLLRLPTTETGADLSGATQTEITENLLKFLQDNNINLGDLDFNSFPDPEDGVKGEGSLSLTDDGLPRFDSI
eukprot:Colp12_sorted_trinity150504_noHs@5053